jgi:tetratricopeptide (TPR) repeat protein
MDRKRLGQFVTGVTAALFVLTLGSVASAQTGMLKGKVLDAKEAPVDGAKVTITAKGMKSTREVKTNKKVGRAGPSPEVAAKAAALQKSFDEGVAMSKAGDFDGSIVKFNEAIAQAPNCHDCYYNIGYAYAQKKEWDKAEVAYKKATELKPDYAEAWSGLANAYNTQKKLDLALEASANAAKYSGATGDGGGGGSASSLYNQGVILWNQAKYAEAKEKFEAAAKADPSYSDAHYRLGMANLNLGDMPGAAAAFEGYLKAAPTGEYAEQVKGILASIKK